MVLGTPAALWGLLLIPLVVLLYLLRARREPRVISSTLLWERAARDLVARLPVRRLERSVLLLLQLLVVAAVVGALARPLVALRGFTGDAVVLVVDATASMQATDVPPSRLAAAQAEALAVLAGLGPRQPAAVLAVAGRPRLLLEFTTDRAAARAALGGVRPTDTAGGLEDAVALAASLRAGGRPAVVHVFSDEPPGAPGVVWHRVGRGAPNAGITALRARNDAARRAHLMVRVEAVGAPADRRLVARMGPRVLAERRVRVVPGAPQTVLLDLGHASGVVTVTLEGSDALAADDRAVLAVGADGRPRVLVVGDATPVLDAALAAVPTGGIERVPDASPAQWGRASVVVLDRVPVAQPLPPGAYLLVGTVAPNLPLQITGVAGPQVVQAVASTHPVVRLADLRGARVAEALALRPHGGAVLAEGETPLVWAFDAQGLRVVLLPFDPSSSELAVHPAFPVLVANAIDWLTGGGQVAAGAQPVVPAGPWARASLRGPDGHAVDVEARDGRFALPPLDRIGAWRLRTGGWERLWVVAAADARETAAVAVPPPTPAAAASGSAQVAQVSLTPALLAMAAVLLGLEWALWTRSLPRRGQEPQARLRGARR
ncbi:MAG: VWA domain-containing protein [Armatimonadota bacterium]|nr:VWA domain-containing protein [Armatimonadota bacterium]MDR7532905.1 VWA domain-containing protein [Armatimonadota bacterium]MDR7536112.1 VWA domain-containing protein [Armatimonadota bacterium]